MEELKEKIAHLSLEEKVERIEFTSLVIEDIISTCMWYHAPFGDLSTREALRIAKQIQQKTIRKTITRILDEDVNEENLASYLTEGELQIGLKKFTNEFRRQTGQPRMLTRAEYQEFFYETGDVEEFWNSSYLVTLDPVTMQIFSKQEDSHLNAADMLTLIAISDPEKTRGWTRLSEYYTKLRAVRSAITTHFLPTTYLRGKDTIHFLLRHKQLFPENGGFDDGVKHSELMYYRPSYNVDDLLHWLALQQWDMYSNILKWNLDSYPAKFLEIVKWTADGITYNIRT